MGVPEVNLPDFRRIARGRTHSSVWDSVGYACAIEVGPRSLWFRIVKFLTQRKVFK